MQPVQALVRQIIVILISMIAGYLVRKEIISLENADTLRPLIVDVVVEHLPLILPGITSQLLSIYDKFISAHIFATARNLPAGATEHEVMHEALGQGGKRTAAKVLLGVK